MNESTCSSTFQTKLRQALPNCVLIKHADKSLIGCLDASLTAYSKTVWLEYKFIGSKTMGVLAEFMRLGWWEPLDVASASPTQFDMAKRLAIAGHACYLFWVLDHEAIRMRVKHVVMWHPITGVQYMFANTDGVVEYFMESMTRQNPLDVLDQR